MPLRLLALSLVAALWLPQVAAADDVPPNLRAAILLRAFGYERRLAATHGPLSLVVVSGSSRQSAADARAMARAFESVSGQGGARALRVSTLAYEGTAKLVEALKQAGPALVYLAPDVDVDDALLGLAQRTIIVCGDPEAVAGSCALSVELHGGSPRVVVDLGDARRMGLDFDSRLLRLSRVIR